MSTQLIIFSILLSCIAALAGAAIAHWQHRKLRKSPRSPKESLVDAARRRAMERAAAPRHSPQASVPDSTTTPSPRPVIRQESPSAVEYPTVVVTQLPPENAIKVGDLTVTLLNRQVPPTAAETSDKDAWENWSDEMFDPYSDGKKLAIDLQITYLDSNNVQTKRRITTERYTHNGRDGILHAMCHMRESRRSFRVARIQEAVDLGTGEVIAHLPAWLDAQYEKSDEGQLDAFMDEHDAALASLFFIAKADGAFRQPEKNVVSDLCDGWGFHLTPNLIKTMSQWAVPSKIGYGKALRELAEKPDDYQEEVLAAASKIVMNKKTPSDAEKKALDRMQSILTASRT